VIAAALDNDVLTKGARYGLLTVFFEALALDVAQTGVLETALYVVSKRIRQGAESNQRAVDEIAFVLARCQVFNPTQRELDLATELEVSARELGVALDAGESQLCAIVVIRTIALLLTGDKRAVEAMQALAQAKADLQYLHGKVRCLEQILLAVLNVRDFEWVRDAVCRAMDVDKALTYCFACHSNATRLEEVVEGLRSYVAAIDGQRLLMP
jgi:hypothetical protein